jgi:hypothetical protein
MASYPNREDIVIMVTAVLKGQVPGVKKQTGLFLDGLGHPTKPLKDFVGYSELPVCCVKAADLESSVVQRHGTI